MTSRLIDSDEATREGTPRRSYRAVAFVVLVAVVGVVVFVVGTLMGSSGRAPAADPTPSPTLRADEVAPGLTRGTATVELGNSDALYGVPVGWERDLDGAAGAAMNYIAATHSLVNYLPDTREELVTRIYTPSGVQTLRIGDEEKPGATLAAFMRNHLGMDVEGNAVSDGAPSPDERIYAEAYPRFGAYRIDAVERDAEDLPTLVTLKVWMPAIGGPAPAANARPPWTDLDRVKVAWYTEALDVEWYEGDWRINAVAIDLDQPTPYEARRTNQPYSNVAALLGPGWLVPLDGTDQPYPGAVLTR